MSEHRTTGELEAATDVIAASPDDGGRVEMIVRRPAIDEREAVDEGMLSTENGLVGDTWNRRGSSRTADGGPHPGMQLTLMNARFVDVVAGARDRWALAGDQIYVDLDLGEENLPAGTRLSVGTAVIEISDQPHTGCAKFSARFGRDALRFVNSPTGRRLRLRGVNAFVVENGTVTIGDVVEKR
jgi:MOSC domain-containing protein YiiM